MKYVVFPKGEQKKFLEKVKIINGFTWDQFANELDVHRTMMFFYAREESKLPEKTYLALCKLSKIKNKNLKTTNIDNKALSIKRPSLNLNLAEFIGALAGDGHISKINYEVSISGHKELDYHYLTEHLSLKSKKLFGVTPKLRFHKTSKGMKILINSKELYFLFVNMFKLPSGKKKGALHIPKQILDNNKFLKSYLRGLFDTDGSVYTRRKNEMVVSIISRDPPFLEEVKKAFEKLDYSPSISGKNLYLYRKKEVKQFFDDVRPANEKHKKRFEIFSQRELSL